MKKYLLIFCLFTYFSSNAQRIYVAGFIDSVATSNLYNPFKIDTMLTEAEFTKSNWYNNVRMHEQNKKFDEAYDIFEPKKNSDPLAMYLLGKYFYYGLSSKTSVDKPSAYLWFLKAANAKFPPAYEAIAKMTFLAEDRIQSDSTALVYLKSALNGGLKSSLSEIAYVFQTGTTRKNLDSAMIYYEKAMAEKDLFASHNVAAIYKVKGMPDRMLSKYIEGDKENLPISSRELGNAYLKGIGVKKDILKAKEYLQKACKARDGGACGILGLIAIDEGKSDNAHDYFILANKYNELISKYNLARCVSEGIGCKAEPQKAFELYKKLDLPEAQNNIGTLYERNLIEKNNVAEAKRYYDLAANRGNVWAMLNLGRILTRSEKDNAVKWYEKAANFNNTEAVSQYLRFTSRSLGVAKALQLSEKFSVSDNKNIKIVALRFTGDVYRQRADSLAKADGKNKATAEGLARQAINKAIEAYEKATRLDDDTSMVRLGQLYYLGSHVKKDYQKAEELWERAEKLGNPTAMYNLGYLLEKDTTFYRNNALKYQKAIDHYKSAIKSNKASSELKKDAAFRLGNIYQYPYIKEFEKNSREAIRWYTEAAELNDADAMYEIGYIYENGEKNPNPKNSVEQDKDKAKEWYRKAAKLKNEDALNALKKMGE